MAVKTCLQCWEEKPFSAFSKIIDKRKGSDYVLWSQGCKSCISNAQNALRKLRRSQDPRSLRERFEQYYQPIPWTGCWLWTGSYQSGYEKQKGGQFSFLINGKRRPEAAYRVAWRIYKGEIPLGMSVCHRCDVRACVNPDHLFLGTHVENMHDMILKKRHPRIAFGEDHREAKLNEAKVLEIRASQEPTRTLAAKYGVTHRNIVCVQKRITWKWVGEKRGC